MENHIKELKGRYDNLLSIRLDNPDDPCHVFPGLVDIHNHIDFDDAIKTLDALFQDFNKEYGKNFVRGKLLSSYDLSYQDQIKS